MSKKITVTIAASFLLFQTGVFGADSNKLTSLDAQRDNLLKQITAQLVDGKIGPTDAQQLKAGLDNVIQLETQAQEDNIVSDSEYAAISNALEAVRTQAVQDTHGTKVWMGIDSHNITLQKKISDALANRKISKDQADGLMQEEQLLRARESNGSPTNEFDFTAAMSIAQDLLALDGKIDQMASAGHTQ